MKKVFGYPKYDAQGEKKLTGYDDEYREMQMDIRVFQMEPGAVRSFQKPEEEMAILLLRGRITLGYEGETATVSRKDVFSEGLWCLHVAKGTAVTVESLEETEILVQCTHNARCFDSKLYGPADAPWVWSCKGKWGNTGARRVSTVFDYETAPYSNMVIGEVLNDPGNWSGYVPHWHPQPEVYYFLFDRPEGFGASFVGEEVYKITQGSFSAIPGGKTHPQAAAPGYQMYTCWMIRHLEGDPWTDRIEDERYTWLNDR